MIMVKDAHKPRYPKMTIDKEADSSSSLTETLNDARHEITDDDQIAHTNAEALDGYRSVEYHGCVGIGDLGKGEERGRSSLEVSCASCLKIEAKACGKAGPYDDEDT